MQYECEIDAVISRGGAWIGCPLSARVRASTPLATCRGPGLQRPPDDRAKQANHLLVFLVPSSHRRNGFQCDACVRAFSSSRWLVESFPFSGQILPGAEGGGGGSKQSRIRASHLGQLQNCVVQTSGNTQASPDDHGFFSNSGVSIG